MDDSSVKLDQSGKIPRLSCAVKDRDMSAVITIAGDWLMGSRPAGIEAIFDKINSGVMRKIAFDCKMLGRWDSSLIVLMRRLSALAQTAHLDIDYDGLPDGLVHLLEMAAEGSSETVTEPPKEHFYRRVGLRAIKFASQCIDSLSFLGEVTISFAKLIIAKSRMRRVDFVEALYVCGPDSLGIVVMISLLVGLVVSFIGAMQLEMFGAEIFVADMVVIAMLREMGPIMTGIIIAGRVGASFAATLAAMKVNEEADALETLGISPVDFLALPRILAMILMLPLLVLFSNFTGILGGALAGGLLLDVSFWEYYSRTVNALGYTNNLLVGLIKAVAFGAVISISGCRRGLRCSGSSSEVGRATTKAVVDAIIWIVIVDSIAAVVCQFIGY